MSWDESDDADTIPCPYCRKQIYEDAVRCPYCENYISSEEVQRSNAKPWWLIIGVFICLFLVYRWIMG